MSSQVKILLLSLSTWFFVAPTFSIESERRVLDHGKGGLDWRLTSMPKGLASLSLQQASNIVSNFSFTDQDAQNLIAPALVLPNENAAEIVSNYVKRYEQKNSKLGPAWGRAVFCLGLVQARQAKKHLFELWDKHDRRFARSKSKIGLDESLATVNALRVIGDAIGFYLDDSDTREWFLKRISEADEIDRGDLSSPGYIRRDAREQLLVYLYRWDLIDSVDGRSAVAPERLLSWHFATEASVTNISLAAQRFVEWVKQIPHLNPAWNEQEWIKWRSNPRVHRLDSTAIRLGRELSFALWKTYLRQPMVEGDAGVRAELWATATGVWPHYLNRHEMGTWKPSAEESAFLTDAISYFEQLPNGYYRDLFAAYLWKIACFAPDTSDNKEISRIRQLAGARLSAEQKEVILAQVKQSRKAYEAVKEMRDKRQK